MNGIEILLEEHNNILTFVEVVRKICCEILEGQPIVEEDFREVIQFARSYADKHHHGKEEQILFREMTAQLGPLAVNLIQHGMLVEHDMGRLYVSELESALERYLTDPNTMDKLQLLTGAVGYTNLLQRHVEKENNAVYPFAQRSLSQEILDTVDAETQAFEDLAATERETSLQLLRKLALKYA